MANYVTPPLVTEVVSKWDKAQGHHAKFVKAYERRERSYRGLLAQSTQGKWNHQYHPKYAFNLIETIVATTVEMGLRFDVRPSPKVNMTQQDAIALLDQTEAVGDLLRHEHRVDEMDMKQRPLYLTAAIGGRGIGKCAWNYTEGMVRKQGTVDVPITDGDGSVLMTVPTITEITQKGILHDHSTFEVVDPRDFILHESAKTLQPWEPGGAQYLFNRCWYSKEQLLMWQQAGFFQNVDLLSETLSFTGEYADREQQMWNVNRTKDLIEVLEYWCFKNGQVYRSFVGNRCILLRDEEPSPFWHGGYPFVVCSSMPQPFTTIGMSDIELVEHLQQILWELQNQTLDNIELINNFITLIRSDVADPDAFEMYPGARWPVSDPNEVSTLQPPYQLANVTAAREALVKGDLQNITSAAPLAGGDTGSLDQTTATGASIVMNAAQQKLAAKKFQAQQALRQEAQMRIQNCQQFIDGERLVHILGPGGVPSFRSISALDIQGDFIVELTAMGESQMRQERRAEAGTVYQMMSQAFPQSYASGTPIDMHRVLLWVMRQYGLEDEADAFFEPQQQPDPGTMNLLFGNAPKVQIRADTDPQSADSALQATGSGGQQPPGQPNMGTTAATAVDASKPSATGGNSMSPVSMLQRALAMRGGLQK